MINLNSIDNSIDKGKNIFVTVAGPRDYTDKVFVNNILDKTLSDISKKESLPIHIVEGGAYGVDALAKLYALQNKIAYTEVKADWNKYGRSAGPRRNQKMAEMSDYCIVFYKGTRGSASMVNEALKKNVPVYIISISEKFGIGKIIYVNDSKDWEKLKSEFEA